MLPTRADKRSHSRPSNLLCCRGVGCTYMVLPSYGPPSLSRPHTNSSKTQNHRLGMHNRSSIPRLDQLKFILRLEGSDIFSCHGWLCSPRGRGEGERVPRPVKASTHCHSLPTEFLPAREVCSVQRSKLGEVKFVCCVCTASTEVRLSRV